MSATFLGLGALEHGVALIAGAETPSDVFRRLIEATGVGSPRAAIFLSRAGGWKGWGAVGYPAAAGERLRATSVPFDRFPRVTPDSPGDPVWVLLDPASDVPPFGQPAYDEAAAFALRVGGKPVAAVFVERLGHESPWHTEAVAVLVHAARMRLEMDLAWRRVKAPVEAPSAASPAPAPPEPLEPAPDPVPAREAEIRLDVGDDRAPETLELSPWADPAAAPGHDPVREEIRRFARLVATDIRLYNEDAVQQGRAHGDLARRLAEPMQRGRESFLRRFPDSGEVGRRALRDAYVQVLAGGDGGLVPD